ncbi:hypothetical protein [Chitinimonas sp.]|uniref:hypothetical protein n=1 Tax=Chitinimonas sp. TaxID=1934313 RepID=UPI0035AEACC0
MKRSWWIGLALVASAQAAEMGTVLKASELKQKPFSDAAKVAEVGDKTSVEIVTRQGAWIQVKTRDGQAGWLKMLNVRTGSGETKSDGGGGLLAGVSLFKTGSSGTTVTTGVKGLSEDDLRNAQPNPAELAKLDGYASSSDEAAKFAKAGKLSANRDLAYLAKSDKNR